MNSTREWVETSTFGAGLGVQLDEITDTSARLVLPFRTENSNPGDALHGGCAASLGLIGGHAIARTVLGDNFATFHTANCQVSYLAAAIGEEVHATTTLLRRGKEMCFSETTVTTNEGKPISHITSLVRGRKSDQPTEPMASHGDKGESDPGEMGPFIGMMPFTKARQLNVEHMVNSEARIVMPLGDANGDRGGGFHEGAALALLDTTGAMAAWAAVGPGNHKASTAALQAQVVGSLHADDLVGYGQIAARDGDLFWADVEVADAKTQHVQIRGTVIYRIIT